MKKKIIPFIAVGVLIVVILLFIALGNLIEKYTPTKERKDLDDYYSISSQNEAAIILDHKLLDTKAKVEENVIYLEYEMVKSFNPRFYWDYNENILRYTTSSDLITVHAGESQYTVTKDTMPYDHPIVKTDGDQTYVALDFVRQYSDFNYEVYNSPNRIVMTGEWGDYETAVIKKDTQLRYQGGIKSPILADLSKETEIIVLMPDEKWTKVATADGIIGYVRSKLLSETTVKTAVSEYVPESFSHIKKDFKINMGWHQVTTETANSTISTVLPNSKGLNVISPTWFYLNDNNGNIASLASKDYVDYCHQHQVEVWALVSNLENKEVNTTEVLTYTSRRETLVNNLISAAIQFNLDGINVDLEALKPEAGDAYIQFIRELSLKCEANNIVLSVDNYVPTDYTAFYNRAEQALFADYIAIMAYDEHYAGSDEAGSVASIGFVTEGVQNTLNEVPAEQIILGMPFYTRVWSETPITSGQSESTDNAAPNPDDANDNENMADNHNGQNADETSDDNNATEDDDFADSYQLFTLDSYATNMNEISKLLSSNGVTPVWSDADGQYYAEYLNNGITYKIWIENAVSLEEKLKVLKEYNLAGGAFWKLGLESSDVWDIIIKYIN